MQMKMRKLTVPCLHLRSLAIMQEKLHRAEALAAKAENTHSNERELEARIASLEIELQAWTASASELGVDGHEGLAGKLTEVQNEYLLISEKLGDSEAEARRLSGK